MNGVQSLLVFPEKTANLTKAESYCWDNNIAALRDWSKTSKAFKVPTWALEKFCRQVVHYGSPDDIPGLLKDIFRGKNTE